MTFSTFRTVRCAPLLRFALGIVVGFFALIGALPGAQASPLNTMQQWIGGLDDSGKRILSASMVISQDGIVLEIWQKTGDLYVAHFGPIARDEAPFSLRTAQGDTFAGSRQGTQLDAQIDVPSLNIRGRIVLAERGSGAAAQARYEALWHSGFFGPESFQQLAVAAAGSGDTDLALSWLRRGREARRPLSDALAFSNVALDRVRADPRFRAIINDPVAGHPELSQQRYRIRVDRGVRIPTREGLMLLADIYRPDAPGQFPVILIRTPYGRGADIPPGGVDHFAPRGYVVVIQSVRGRDGSEGNFEPWLHERQDGYDAIDWVSRQPWSDGNVGMMGLSYLGQAQWQAAVEAHPALRAIIPEVAGTDSFLDTPYDHGILRLSLLSWARGMIPPSRRRSLPEPDDRSLLQLPLSRLDQAYVGETMPLWQQIVSRDSGERWSASNFLADLDKVHIPTLSISGWWDGEANSTMRNFRTMRELGRTNQWLIYGPWPHVWNESTSVLDQEYGPSARIDFQSLAVRWFDQWLKRKPVNFEAVPRAQIFVTGANRWRTFSDWPAPGGRPLDLYLSSGADRCSPGRSGILSAVQYHCGPAEYRYDPAQVSADGPGVFRSNSTTLNVDTPDDETVVFETEPFDRPVTIAAPGSLELSFSTTAHDADFFVVVFDRDEAGVARALAGPGKMRMSFRDGWDRPTPLEPNRIYRGSIELRPFAHMFAAGHRLGVVIRSEWFPDFARNLNTGEPIGDAVRTEAARIRIFGDVEHPSILRVSTVPE